jgi:hypothetical protein
MMDDAIRMFGWLFRRLRVIFPEKSTAQIVCEIAGLKQSNKFASSSWLLSDYQC